VPTSSPKPSPASAPVLLAAEQAVDHGSRLLRQGQAHVGSLIPKGDRDYATSVDFSIERVIKHTLARATPEIPFLGEEEGGDFHADTLWTLDPIDGTLNFIKGSPLCCISLALLSKGQPMFGIVDLPLLGERYIAREGGGAYLNGGRLHVADVKGLHDAMVGLADFAVGPEAAYENRIHLALIKRLAVDAMRIRVHGSAAMDLAWLAAGHLNASVMLSNLPWDVSAGVLLVREAGGLVYDVDGTTHSTRSRFTIASVPGLSETLCEVVADAG
jgi:myo-inositol-1(or 4)-monophosphatase